MQIHMFKCEVVIDVLNFFYSASTHGGLMYNCLKSKPRITLKHIVKLSVGVSIGRLVADHSL